MKICQGCGGVLGRDCWNEQECIWISQSQQIDNQQQIQQEINLRDEHIRVLQEAVKAFLNVINRTPAALHHYADAIKMGEDALGITEPQLPY